MDFTQDLTECTLCNEQYNASNRRARNLSCGHYYCQDCLSQIITWATPHCPACRAEISVRSAESLPPNFLMDDLISKMKSGAVLVDSKTKVEESDDDFSAGECPKHKPCKLYFTCRSHKMKVCRDCTVLDHNSSRCEIISFEDEMKDTKESTISNLKNHKAKREKNIKDLQDIIIESEATIQKIQDNMNKLQKKVNKRNQMVNKANAGIRDCKENKIRIESVQRELTSSITINQLNQACKQAESVMKSSNSLGKSMESNFNITGFIDLTDQDPVVILNKVLQSNATFHATAEVNGQKRYAQLIVKDGHVLLPALASCNSPPSPNKTLTVASLLGHYSNTDIYLTLANDGKQLGTFYVKLRDNALAMFIRKICLGTIGPCYRGSVFKWKGDSHITTEAVSKYDSSNCTEVPPPTPEIVFIKKGMVCIIGGTGLVLGVNNAPSFPLSPVGDVINGMSVIENAYKCEEGQVNITDVGIVLK